MQHGINGKTRKSEISKFSKKVKKFKETSWKCKWKEIEHSVEETVKI